MLSPESMLLVTSILAAIERRAENRNRKGTNHGFTRIHTDREKDRHELHEFALNRSELRERKIFDEMRDSHRLHRKERRLEMAGEDTLPTSRPAVQRSVNTRDSAC